MENFPLKILNICPDFPLILILNDQTWKIITNEKYTLLSFPLILILNQQTWKVFHLNRY